jgi:hypothetical protein
VLRAKYYADGDLIKRCHEEGIVIYVAEYYGWAENLQESREGVFGDMVMGPRLKFGLIIGSLLIHREGWQHQDETVF